MLATALKTLETQPGPIADIISDRVDVAELSEDATYPRVVNVQVSDLPDGVAHTGEVNVYMARWQVDCYAQDFDTCERLARALWETFVPLQRYPVSDVIITSCRRVSQRFFHERPLNKWRFLTEFEFRYSYDNQPGWYRFPDYSEKVLSYSPITYWPMWEADGSVSHDISGNSPAGEQDGAYTGVQLGRPGIGDGRTCPLFDGINDYNNVFSAAIVAALNGDEGTLQMWWLHAAAAHNDSSLRRLFFAQVDANNFIIFSKTGTNSNMQFDYKAGGTSELHSLSIASHRTVFSVGHMTWSKANDRVTYYDNGVQIGQDTGLGVWSGDIIRATIGATNTIPGNPYLGKLAHMALWDRELEALEVADLAVV